MIASADVFTSPLSFAKSWTHPSPGDRCTPRDHRPGAVYVWQEGGLVDRVFNRHIKPF